jgi:hypothetical protein
VELKAGLWEKKKTVSKKAKKEDNFSEVNEPE